MSLYGTGRREGIFAALTLVVLVAAVHALGASWSPAPGGASLGWLADAALPALAATTCYRFLRAAGRSRYAAFLAAAAYGLSPWLLALDLVANEQFAAASAPLALEAAQRCGRAAQRGLWLPWIGACLAAPFAAGPTVTATCALLLGTATIVHDVVHGDRGTRRAHARQAAFALAFATIATTTLLLLAPVAVPLGTDPPTPASVLAAHRPGTITVDLAALLRLPGAVLVCFAALGVLRQQRYVTTATWLGLAVLGAMLSLCGDLLPASLLQALGIDWLRLLPTAGWWLVLVSLTVLAAAGLDDFLDLPMRRRSALPWLPVAVTGGVPLVLACGAAEPEHEWAASIAWIVLACLLMTWRRLGILRFKNVLAVAALAALTLPAVQVLVWHPTPLMPAAPGGEIAPPRGFSWHAAMPPLTDYRGLLAVVLVAAAWALSAWCRSTTASAAPARAKPAITKKAKPSARS